MCCLAVVVVIVIGPAVVVRVVGICVVVVVVVVVVTFPFMPFGLLVVVAFFRLWLSHLLTGLGLVGGLSIAVAVAGRGDVVVRAG